MDFTVHPKVSVCVCLVVVCVASYIVACMKKGSQQVCDVSYNETLCMLYVVVSYT